ncbi:MAG: bifunctional metallophosphatase/5'-nucleotidase [Rubrimonas sp.]|uniref:bifunctional metallophosphatase/5'-nucleotidase n=1 Tax=Rubrimonas sp. TaxID=2036015 RepID=UPI002FDD9E9F
MRRRLALAAPLAASIGLAAAPASAEFALTILHINDFHSRMEPISKFDSTCSAEDDAKGECFGGVARLKTAIDARRAAIAAAGGHALTLDAGDQFQGSLFYTTYKGADAAEMMNAIGFDAMAVGNHEFDDGPAVLAAFAAALEAPLVSGNTVVSQEPALAGKISPSVVLEVGGEKVGIVSALTPDTAVIASPGPTVTFLDEIERLKADVAELEAQGVTKIVALTHVGFGRDLEIAAAVPGIDVIVGGHSHTLLANAQERATGPYPVMATGPDGDVPIVQAYAYGKFLGELRVVWDDAGRVTSATGEPILLDASVTPDPAIAARLTELAAPIEALKGQVVGEASAPIDGSRETCRLAECQMGVLVTDALLDRARPLGAAIAITNGGGLRASIDAGPVTMGEVLTVLPFQNTMATFTASGAEILAALENGVSKVEEQAGRFPQVAGLRFTWSAAKPAGARILSVEVETAEGWAPLDPAADYGVVSNNYMRNGGDGYAMFREARDAYDYGPGLDEVVASFVAANAPYAPRLAGRITQAD